jgi:[ribosomal protein S5]-alanine N-acetyltransferase
MVLRPPRPSDIPELRRVLRRNAEHLRPWLPRPRPGEDPTSLMAISNTVLADRRGWRTGGHYVLMMMAKGNGAPAPIFGRITLFGVTRGAYQSAQLGYWIDAGEQRKGLAREAVRAVVDFAFGALALHRVQANVMPRNLPSRRLIESLGFRLEGLAERLIETSGVWEDHLVFALTADEWRRV